MEYMGTREASIKWGVPQETIAKKCREHKIDGVEHDDVGCPWRIPIDTECPFQKKGDKWYLK